MTSSVARVVAVITEPAGSVLRSDATSGDTLLEVENAADFNEEGGQIYLEDDSVLAYTMSDTDTDILALAAPLAADVWVQGDPDGDRGYFIGVYPLSMEMKAVIIFEDDNDEGIQATIPLELQSYFVEGIREVHEREAVIVDDESGEWRVTDVADEKTIRGDRVNPEGLEYPVALFPPEISPIPTVYGTADSLVIKVDPTIAPPGATIDYHISTADSFNADSTTLAVSTKQSVVVVTEMPDGGPLVTNTPYYVRTIASNEAGEASQSDQAPGMLDPSVVSQIIAAQIVAGFILAGSIAVGNITIDPEIGIRIPQPDGGQIYFPSSGTDFAEITAHLVAQSLNIKDNLVISGAGQLNGVLDLKSGITRPKNGPTMAYEWPKALTILGNGTDDNAFLYNGLTSDVDDATGNVSVTAIAIWGGSGIRFFDHRTGIMTRFPDPTAGKTWTTDFYAWGGVAADAARGVYYVLGSDSSRSGNWYLYAINSTTFVKVGEILWWSSAGVASNFPRIAYYNNVLHIVFWQSGSLRFRKVSVSGTSSSVSFSNINGSSPSDTVLESSSATAIADLEIGVFDSPTSTVNVAYRPADSSYWRVRLYSNPANSSAELGSFLAPATKMRGLRWIGGTHGPRFAGFDNVGYMHYFSDFRLNTTVRATHAWFDPESTTQDWDSSTPNAAGTHETQESQVYTEFGVQCRSWLSVTAPPAPDEANNDPMNDDKATASRLYVGAGSGTRYLQGTVGKSVRQISGVNINNAATYTDRPNFGTGKRILWADMLGKLNAFVAEDIGATVSGTNIAAGTKIVSVPSQYAGQAAIIDTDHTATNSTVTVTVERSQFGRKLWTLPTLVTGSKTPEVSNGFSSAAASPARVKSLAEDSIGPLILLEGSGGGRVGPWRWGEDGLPVNYPVASFVGPTPNLTTASAWAKVTGWNETFSGKNRGISESSGNFTVSEDGWYQISFWAEWANLGATVARRLFSVFTGTTAGSGTEMMRQETNHNGYLGATGSMLWYFSAGGTFCAGAYSNGVSPNPDLTEVRLSVVKVSG